MIKFEHMEVMGWEHAIRGMRNPKRSHAKSDSDWEVSFSEESTFYANDDPVVEKTDILEDFVIGPNDHDLMMRLSKAGSDHRKYMRMLDVYVDITAPLYWWKEFDTYRVGVEKNSDSTMHMIHAKEFTLDDFSHEHLIDNFGEVWDIAAGDERRSTPLDILYTAIDALNIYREKYLEIDSEIKKCHFDKLEKRKELTKQKKTFWWQMIQLLPSSYNQKRTVKMSYEALANMYKARKNHKLDEWRTFCSWIEELPCSEIIIGGYLDDEKPDKE